MLVFYFLAHTNEEIITEICKVSSLWLKALNKQNTHMLRRRMYVETENVIHSLTNSYNILYISIRVKT